MFDSLRTVRGMVRSLRIYYGDRQHGPAMDRLYRNFVQPRDLVFDIGAHVGDRIAAFRRLGAPVVAVEPQPALLKTLRLLYGGDPMVTVEAAAVGQKPGVIELNVNVDNPTVSTASADFIAAAANAPGWEGQAWSKRIRVPLMTIGSLVARHGTPASSKSTWKVSRPRCWPASSRRLQRCLSNLPSSNATSRLHALSGAARSGTQTSMRY